MKKSLPTLLLEAERAFDESDIARFQPLGDSAWKDTKDEIKRFYHHQILSILSEAERATEGLKGQRLKYINEDRQLNTEFDIALNAVKSLWREWRGNLK